VLFYLFTTIAGLITTYLSFVTGFYTGSIGVFVFTLAICLSLSSIRQLIRTSYLTYIEYIQHRQSYQIAYPDRDSSTPLAFSATDQHDK